MSPRKSTGLSTKSKSIVKKSRHVQKIVFDDDARREYLTGFHKRNLEKKEARQKKAIERQRLERLELRKQHRQELAERAAENVRAVEMALGITHSDAEVVESEDEAIQDQELEFENHEQFTVVTVVDDLSVDSLRRGDDRPFNESENEFNKISNSHSVASVPVTKQAAKPRLQKVKYETKAARKTEKAKQKARKWKKDQVQFRAHVMMTTSDTNFHISYLFGQDPGKLPGFK